MMRLRFKKMYIYIINYTVPKNKNKDDTENTQIHYQARYKVSHLILEFSSLQIAVIGTLITLLHVKR